MFLTPARIDISFNLNMISLKVKKMELHEAKEKRKRGRPPKPKKVEVDSSRCGYPELDLETTVTRDDSRPLQTKFNVSKKPTAITKESKFKKEVVLMFEFLCVRRIFSLRRISKLFRIFLSIFFFLKMIEEFASLMAKLESIKVSLCIDWERENSKLEQNFFSF